MAIALPPEEEKKLLSAIPVPDLSMRGKEIQPIRGEVTSPIDPKPGCRFLSRCDHACDKCREPLGDPVDFGNGHTCLCARCTEAL